MTPPVDQGSPRTLQLPRNDAGRDFCVGDIHGMFDLLVRLMQKAAFNPGTDRLISVGDLVDRGPASQRAAEFLGKPWFHAIRGNHEAMLIDCVENPDDGAAARLWLSNGGDWWHEASDAERMRIYAAVKPLPIVIEVETAIGSVGVVHADIPPALSWQEFVERVTAGDEDCIQTALWSRTRAKLHKVSGDVAGVRRVYCGHNIVDAPLMAGNVHFIDTGAYLGAGGSLSLVQINHADEPVIHLSQAH